MNTIITNTSATLSMPHALKPWITTNGFEAPAGVSLASAVVAVVGAVRTAGTRDAGTPQGPPRGLPR